MLLPPSRTPSLFMPRYLNNTGLMWENAPKFGALMVFAEHRWAEVQGEQQPVSLITNMSAGT
jgi:hypothetical protein